MTTSEIWKDIAGYSGAYQVSNLGRVRSFKRAQVRVLRPGTGSKGYLHVNPSGAGRRGTREVHALVAEAFLGPRPDGHDARHLDGDKLNNAVGNLAYGSRSANNFDMVRHGTHNEARKTHCPQAHPYTGQNLLITATGKRQCRTCKREAWRNDQRWGKPGRPFIPHPRDRTHCVSGHRFDEANTYLHPRGDRVCRACKRNRRRAAARRAAA